ncbi:Arylsulphatase [Xylariaceae sp. FL0255]|nr:Arylsulphatase [Xylariaceae sp. FL0255]
MSHWLYVLASVVIGAILVQGQSHSKHTSHSNLILVLTDDQDVHLDSLKYMPLVKKHLVEQGTYFSKHYCTTSVCCPSRVSLWTGKLAHNTNVTDVIPPYGGYPKFISEGFNKDYLPVWLQKAGYSTYYTGKFLNYHTIENYDKPHAEGFSVSDFLLDPYTYEYYNATFQHNNGRIDKEPKSYQGNYSTDVIAENSYHWLKQILGEKGGKNPFFMTIAPIAPHANVHITRDPSTRQLSPKFTEPVPAKRHEHLFQEAKVPRTGSFNPDQPSGATWILNLPKQNQSNLDYNDHFYRQRLRSLQAVDEMVEGLIWRLDAYGALDNTYIIYTSDNGYHIGQHRLQPGKTCGYEEDINVPLIIRGPGVAKNHKSNLVTTHTDLAPTILDLLNVSSTQEFDGRPIPLRKNYTERSAAVVKSQRHEIALVEYWGQTAAEGENQTIFAPNHTYKGVRVSDGGFDLYYSVWCSNHRELYDMNVDHGQLTNLAINITTPEYFKSHVNNSLPSITRIYRGPEHIGGEHTPQHPFSMTYPMIKVSQRLDALLFVLKSCKGVTCRQPWQYLIPGIHSFSQAMHKQHDVFFAEYTGHVQFAQCALGYVLEAEGQMWHDQMPLGQYIGD